ncbi:uncharacterized protein BKA78DRAFT_30429 [Phyllosticta capitalensis]|uniref:uncharacterized protein n=1 Tax=Phyllosticta capitalensis TaxID=121624 RepID=UPI0031317D64
MQAASPHPRAICLLLTRTRPMPCQRPTEALARGGHWRCRFPPIARRSSVAAPHTEPGDEAGGGERMADEQQHKRHNVSSSNPAASEPASASTDSSVQCAWHARLPANLVGLGKKRARKQVTGKRTTHGINQATGGAAQQQRRRVAGW